MDSSYGLSRITSVGMSDRIVRRMALAKLTLISAIRKRRMPFSSMMDEIFGSIGVCLFTTMRCYIYIGVVISHINFANNELGVPLNLGATM